MTQGRDIERQDDGGSNRQSASVGANTRRAKLPQNPGEHLRLRAFIEYRLFGSAETAEEPIEDCGGDAPILEGEATQEVRSDLPVVSWWFSRHALATKAFAFLAVITFGLTLASARASREENRIRETAYQRLVAAVEADQDLEAVRAAKAFLSAEGASKDTRARQVRALAEEARDRPNRRIRDQSFFELSEALEKGPLEQILDSSERFLGASSGSVGETRRDAVMEIYSEALVAWTIGLGDSPEVQRRLSNYRRYAGISSTGASK